MRDESAEARRFSVHYDRARWRSALTGWWQSVDPRAPFVKRVIFWAVVGSRWDASGAIEAVFPASGVVMTNEITRSERAWGAIDAVKGVRGGTVPHCGFSMIVSRDPELPKGKAGKAFLGRINRWRTA